MTLPDNPHDNIVKFLRRSRELNKFCTQNGWIDDDSIKYNVLGGRPDKLLIGVHFTEIVMEGSGCIANRISCYGRLRLRLDSEGRIEAAMVD